MTDRAIELVNERKSQLEKSLGRGLELPSATDLPPLSEREWKHLRGEGEDLYWNELEWENLTREESLDGGALTEMAFPGFLAFIRGLLLEEVMPDALAEAAPRPEVVEDLLVFLARRTLEMEEELESGRSEDPDRLAREHDMTSHLVDLVLIQLYSLSPIERAESGAEVDGK